MLREWHLEMICQDAELEGVLALVPVHIVAKSIYVLASRTGSGIRGKGGYTASRSVCPDILAGNRLDAWLGEGVERGRVYSRGGRKVMGPIV